MLYLENSISIILRLNRVKLKIEFVLNHFKISISLIFLFYQFYHSHFFFLLNFF